jgi:hypothetical protein
MINEIGHILSFYLMLQIVSIFTNYFLKYVLTFVFSFLVLDMIGLLKDD